MKKFISVLMIIVFLFALSLSVFAARKITDEEKVMLSNMKGKEILGRKISDSELAALENFLMGTDEPLTQADIDVIMANIDQVINIILQSGVKDLKNLPKDVIDKIMKIADSAASVAGLSVAISSAAKSAPSVTVTNDKGTPVIIPKEKIIKATGDSYEFETFGLLSVILIFIAAFIGFIAAVQRTGIKSAGATGV